MTSKEYIHYQVRQGDRWDTIAYWAYGNPYRYDLILKANPRYLAEPFPPAGAILQIPIIEEEPEEEIKAPWQTED